MVLSRVPTRTLVAAAGFGGLATAAFGFYVRRSRARKTAHNEFYQDAIRVLRKDEGAKFILGVPIVDKEGKKRH